MSYVSFGTSWNLFIKSRNQWAPGFTKLKDIGYATIAQICTSHHYHRMIPRSAEIHGYRLQRSHLRSLGSPGQCDLRQRRPLSLPSLRAKAAETWVMLGLRGERSIEVWDFHLNCSRWTIPFFSPLECWVDPLLVRAFKPIEPQYDLCSPHDSGFYIFLSHLSQPLSKNWALKFPSFWLFFFIFFFPSIRLY